MSSVETRDQEQQSATAPGAQRTSTDSVGVSKGSSFGSIARKVGLVVILAAAAGFTYWKIQSNNQEQADTANKATQQLNRAIPVTTATVASRTMPIYLTELGTVTAYNTVTVKTRVDGQLLTVNVREGQQVKEGQLLAQIDPAPYAAAQAQAEGQLAKDQAAADYAKVEAARYDDLYKAGVVSKDSAQVQTSSAGQSLGVLDADRAAIQAAKVNVAYTKITSPINGVVGLRQVDAGNIVHAADTTGLLVVTQLQPIAVIFTIPEDQLPTVIETMRGGHKLVVEAYDRSESTKLATGSLLTLDNEIDTTTGTVKAKAVFDNRDNALFPNQFVNVRLILEERANSLVMPASALQSGASGSFVYVLKKGNPPQPAADDDSTGAGAAGSGGKGKGKGGAKPAAGAAAGDASADGADAAPKQPYYVDVQNIVVDVTEGTQIILKSGLNVGDQVVVDGQEKLKKYSKVDPKAATPRTGKGGGGGASGGGSAQGVGSTDQSTMGPREGKAGGNAASSKAAAGDESGAGSAGGGHGGKNGGKGSGKGKPGVQQ
jgi:multidrug efflux system membrane fusion protein